MSQHLLILQFLEGMQQHKTVFFSEGVYVSTLIIILSGGGGVGWDFFWFFGFFSCNFISCQKAALCFTLVAFFLYLLD